jgi:Spirocyclase AveC-like
MAVADPRVETVTARPIESAPSFRRVLAVNWWAGLGAAVILAEAVVLIAWISSRWFHHVSSGPTPVPEYMKIGMIAWQVVLPISGLTLIYLFIVRPWRRERRLTTYGLLVFAFSTLWFQDPLSAYGGEWFTYNAYQVNMGSWVHQIPGWLAPGTPSHQIAYPLLVVPGAYITIFLLVSFLGSRLMAAVKARRPHTGRVTLVATCLVAMALFDVVFEGLVFMPLGAWEYPGGHWAIFPTTFHKYPLNEAITTGMLFTSFASITYFVDDRGFTLAERGAESLRATPARAWAIRALAVSGMVALAMFLCYNVTNFFFGLHGTNWPRDIQKRSYLTYTCGPLAGRSCPPSAIKPRGGGLSGR